MRKGLLLLWGITLFTCKVSLAQVTSYCATDNLMQSLLKRHPEVQLDIDKLEQFTSKYAEQSANAKLTTTATTYVIPIVFHVLHNYGPENISDAQIKDAVRILNLDYNKLNSDTSVAYTSFKKIIGNSHFEFRLAQLDPNGNCTNGIDRIVTTQTYNANDSSKLNPWPRGQYLNVWTASKLQNGAAGYAWTPGAVNNTPDIDGIMIVSSYVGSKGTGLGVTSRALTHEIGHFFNLIHPWGQTNSPGVACGDDRVTDTPVTKGWNHCPPGPDSAMICTPGVVENYQNFMDYSYCACMFTAGQSTRMTSAINSTTSERSSLWQASNLTATGVNIDTTINHLCNADFISTSQSVCAKGTVTYYNNSWNGIPTSYAWTFPGGSPHTSTLPKVTVTYDTAGSWDVSLTVANGNQTASTTKKGYINITPVIPTPISEGFESLSLPDSNWTINATGTGPGWAILNGTAANGNKCAYINNYITDTAGVFQLITPALDLTKSTAPKVYFKHAYAPNTGSASTDILRVKLSVNCGLTWASRAGYSSTSLATAAAHATPWAPTSPSDWKQDSVSLASFASYNDVRLMFEFTNGSILNQGGNIYIDDINIGHSNTVVTGLSNPGQMLTQLKFNLFPNPMHDGGTIAYEVPAQGLLDIQLFDLMGRAISTIQHNAAVAAGYHELNFSRGNIAPGIYFVKLNWNNQTTVKKIIIE